jgi:ubiquinol-cytochrome c reductase cytochrome b subunit
MSLFSRMMDALDERTGHRALLRAAGDEPVHGGARWAYVWGSALLAAIMLQAVTGWLLMTSYSPSATTAWASVHYLTYRVSWGWFVRGLHHWGSGATIVLLAAHLAQTALYGAYKKPREMNWWFGLLLMGIVLGFSLTGYLLPWDQKGYWATRVATNIMGTVPLLGGALQKLMQGGNDYGHLTLTRFYALHVGVLPALLVALITAHVYLFRKHGVTPPHGADLKKVDRFWPKQLAYDVIASVIMFTVIVAFVLEEHGAPLDAPADASSDYPARPEWYFLSLFQLLKYFKGPLEPVGTILLPTLAVLFLFALPFLDRKPGTSVRARMPWMITLFAGFASLVVLGLLSARADGRDETFKKARQKADERAAYANQIAMNGIPPEGPLAMLEHDPKLRGEAIWAHDCSGCHTIDGKGGNSAPDLMGWGTKAWVESTMRDPDSTLRFGKSPFSGKMPSVIKPAKGAEAGFTPMKDQDIAEVAAFVSGEGTDDEKKKGKETFSVACNGCHAIDGDGGDDEPDVAPDLGGWGSLRWLRAQIADPANGETYKPGASDPANKGHMPAFGDELKDDVDVIARWVYAQAKGRAPTDAEIADAAKKPPATASSSAAPAPSGSAP